MRARELEPFPCLGWARPRPRLSTQEDAGSRVTVVISFFPETHPFVLTAEPLRFLSMRGILREQFALKVVKLFCSVASKILRSVGRTFSAAVSRDATKGLQDAHRDDAQALGHRILTSMKQCGHRSPHANGRTSRECRPPKVGVMGHTLKRVGDDFSRDFRHQIRYLPVDDVNAPCS
jgi:hypothetical protein